jgi:hypothetical protein
MALNEIKIAGWDGNQEKATIIAGKHRIGNSAFRKAFADGQKIKSRNEPRPETEGKK